MLAFICAECGETSYDFMNVLGQREYHIKCAQCGSKFTVEAKETDRQDNDAEILPVLPHERQTHRRTG